MNLSLSKMFAATIAAASIFTINAQESALHNFASYNVRYTNAWHEEVVNNKTVVVVEDSCEMNWAARGQYVMQIIKNYDFDIVGMEEVTGRSGKVSMSHGSGYSQLEELERGLSDYTFLKYERDGNNNASDYSYNVIAYKTARYQSLDNGCFWLTATPDTPSNGWDPNYTIKRTCGWSKMQDKATGEIFFFAVTHCNYGPSLDGPNGAKVIVDRLSKLAGDYPVVLVGDFNMRRADHPKAYREYVTYFNDAAISADASLCIPEDNRQISWTTTGWTTADKASSGSEFDFVFYRNMHAVQRYVITENFGRGINPSDHFPVLVQFRLGDTINNVYVDKDADSNGDGSIDKPFNTIGQATAIATNETTIHVTADVYREAVSLKTSAQLIGGYDKAFSSIVGKTTIDGDINNDDNTESYNDNISPLIYTQYACTNISNFKLCNARSAAVTTDGAIQANGAEINLYNTFFDNNTANSLGGGINSSCFRINLTDCSFDNNYAKSGSAAYLNGARQIVITGTTFAGNTSVQYGTLYAQAEAEATHFSLWNNTFANNHLASTSGLPNVTKKFGGSAIYAALSSSAARFNFAHNTIVGNIATFAGSNKANYGASAINLFGGDATLMNNIIAANFSDNGRGDIYIDESSTITKEQYNLITDATSVNFTPNSNDFISDSYDACLTAITATLDGSVSDNLFTANLKDNGGATATVKVSSQSFNGYNISTITRFLRYLESSFQYDINGDGSLSGYLDIDQRGVTREASSVPGACEYIDPAGIEDMQTSQSEILAKDLGGKTFLVSYVDHTPVEQISLHDLSGRCIFNSCNKSNDLIFDFSGYPAGVYILNADNMQRKILIK